MSSRTVVGPADRRRGLAALLAALAAVFAAGCASVETAPAGTISKAVAAPCPTSMPAKPAFPVDRLAGDEDVWAIATALWADRQARKAYELELEVRLAGCVGPP